MKVLLIFPNYFYYFRWHWIPTNLVFLAAVVKEVGLQPILIDDRLDNRETTLQAIDQHLEETRLVLISTATGRQLFHARKLAAYIKSKKNVPICVGGAHPTALPELTLTDSHFDFAVAGRGEEAVKALSLAFGKGTPFNPQNIPNLYWRDPAGRIVSSIARTRSLRLENLPELPYWDPEFMDVRRYLNPDTMAINYTTSTGCVGRCAFCYYPADFRYAAFPAERVVRDLIRLEREFHIRNISFDDPTFFVGRERVKQIAQGLLSAGLHVRWRANGRVNLLKRYPLEDMQLVRDSGCDVIHIGLESASERILKLMNKQIDYQDTIHLLEMASQTGITLRFHILLGVPSETIADLRKTAAFIQNMLKIYPDFDYTINFFTPYPGNALTQLAAQLGYQPPQTLAGFESIEKFVYGFLPDNDRLPVKERSPWEHEYDLPWFSPEKQKEYFRVFREEIPPVETIRTTGGKREQVYSE